jgi:ribosomal protein S18 acetylase RimI-like enzyme
MTTFRSRAFAGDVDLERMQALVADATARWGANFECTVGDLDWRMYRASTVHPQANIRMWEDADDRLVGFAWFISNGDVDLVVHPRSSCSRLVPDMVEWGIKRSPGPGATSRSDRAPVFWSLDSNTDLTQALESCGLVRNGKRYLHLLRSLDAEPFPAALPPGYSIRTPSGPAEAAPRAALHRAAFPHSHLTTDTYRRLMASRHYRLELDVVVVGLEGEFAAMALGWLDERNRLGELEPVGTHPAHRRKGLAGAAIQEALRRLRRGGARAAIVYAAAEDARSVELYQRLGFAPVDTNHGFVHAI